MTLVIDRPRHAAAPIITQPAAYHDDEPVALLAQVDTRSGDRTVFVSRDSVVVREDYHVYVGSGRDLSPVTVICWYRDPNSGDLTIITDDQTVYVPLSGKRWAPYYGSAKMYHLDGRSVSGTSGGRVRVSES